ncbi:MAG TPA: hypothetical protein PLC19_08415 [Marmoricola sp.]|nr:hypothetical protein [Marmoricola sp.]HNO39938.1 hypothetical protein [Marmoricola sp.]
MWEGHIWDVDHAGEGWRRYNGGTYYDPIDPTGSRYDQLPISVK